MQQALKSRVHYLTYNPSDEQLAAQMLTIAHGGWPAAAPQVVPAECLEVANFLIAESRRLGCPLDLRLMLDKALLDYLLYRRRETEAHWQDLVIATLEEQLIDLRHPVRYRSLTRRERKETEQQLVQALLADYPTARQPLAAWQERTGKSARAFYARLKELNSPGH